jgi:hypothetical protein
VILRRLVPLILLPSLLALAACSGTAAERSSGSDPDVVEQGAPAGETDSDVDEAADGAEDAAADQGQLVEYGYGQDGQYAAAMALIENTSDHGGQTVTVTVNFLDEAGDIITTESQVESFTHAGQVLALQVWGDLGTKRAKVASIEPTLLVEDEGTFEESDVHFDPVESTAIRNEYGTWIPKLTLQNPTADALQDVRIGVVCRDDAGKIVGGGIDYPDVLPPSGQIVLDPMVTVGSKPSVCTAYPSVAGF